MKKKPLRTCVGCMEKKEKSELIMVVRPPKSEGSSELKVSVGSNKSGGRSVYICKDEQCLKKAKKARRFEKILKDKVSTEIYDDVERLIKSHE